MSISIIFAWIIILFPAIAIISYAIKGIFEEWFEYIDKLKKSNKNR